MPFGLFRSAQAMRRTKPTENTPDDRTGHHRPADHGRRQRVGGNHIGRLVRHREQPRDTGGACRGEQRRQNQPQREHAAQHLDGEQRAAERHAVRRRHACAGAAGDQQAALLIRQRSASASALAITAPACFGAPSRPSDAPMPTTTTDRVAVASVRSAGKRPAKFVIASVMSMLLPLASWRSSTCPAPVTAPAPAE